MLLEGFQLPSLDDAANAAGPDGFAADAHAVLLARGSGALALAVGQKLCELKGVSGELELGYSQLTDLAREKLDLKPAFTRQLVRFEEALRRRPILRAAVLAGEVSRRKAEEIFVVAVGEDEARWVEAAKTSTVRKLRAAVKVARAEKQQPDPAVGDAPAGAGAEAFEEPNWHRLKLWLGLRPPVFRHAVELAGYLDEAPRTLSERLRFMAMEFLSSHPAPEVPDRKIPLLFLGHPLRDPVKEPDLRALFEVRGNAWTHLYAAPPVPAPALEKTSPPDAYAILAELVELVRLWNAWDEELGRACARIKRNALWRGLSFSSFAHYADERLGMATSTVNQRIALERRLEDLPPLREALRTGKLSYERARLVAKTATLENVAEKIAEAKGKTCIALQREVLAEQQDQMWNTGYLETVVPEEVDSLLAEAVRGARHAAGRPMPLDEALEVIARHCIETWAPLVNEKLAKVNPVLLRDGGDCTVPGCSRVADDVHHIRFRSQGGDDSEENQTGMCKPHHLRGVHAGNVLCTGSAPGELTWVLGWREVEAAKGG